MEASAAGLAAGGGDGGDAHGEGGEVESTLDTSALQQPAPAEQQPDGQNEQLTQYLDGFKNEVFQGLDERLGQLGEPQQFDTPEPAQETPPPQQGEMDMQLLDPSSPYYDPGRAAEAMLGAVAQHAEARISEQLAPVQARQEALERNIATQELLGAHPELAKDEVASQVLASSKAWAQDVARELGDPKIAEQLERSPKVWEAMYLRDRASAAAGDESKQDAGPPVATLEGGGGPGPGASTQSVGQQLSERLMRAGSRNPLSWG